MQENNETSSNKNSIYISSILSDTSSLNRNYLNSTSNNFQGTDVSFELKSIQQIDAGKVDKEILIKLNHENVELGLPSIFTSNKPADIDFSQLVKNSSYLAKNYRQNLSRIDKIQDE
jgi:hypothetical protein